MLWLRVENDEEDDEKQGDLFSYYYLLPLLRQERLRLRPAPDIYAGQGRMCTTKRNFSQPYVDQGVNKKNQFL